MLRTRFTELLGIEHPIVLGGMGTGTSPELVAAVCSAILRDRLPRLLA